MPPRGKVLSPDQVEEVRLHLNAGESIRALACAFGVSRRSIEVVAKTASPDPASLSKHRRKLTPEMAVEIRERRAAGASIAALGAEYGLHPDTVIKTCRGRAWGETGGPVGAPFVRPVPACARFLPGDYVEWWCRGPEGYNVWVACKVLGVTSTRVAVMPLRPVMGKPRAHRQYVRPERLRPRLQVMLGGKPTG